MILNKLILTNDEELNEKMIKRSKKWEAVINCVELILTVHEFNKKITREKYLYRKITKDLILKYKKKDDEPDFNVIEIIYDLIQNVDNLDDLDIYKL